MLILSLFQSYDKGSPKKVIFLVASPLRGGKLNGCATKEKRTFCNVRKKVPIASKPRGGGLMTLVARPLRKDSFCSFLSE